MSVTSNNTDTIIAVNGLTKRFGELVAVNDFNIQISKGESFALLGPDGAGKTTTMRLLCRALRPDAGHVKIAGFDLGKQTDQARELIGYMPQRFSLYENLSVLQNIEFFADLYGIDKLTRQKRMVEFLDFSRLAPFVHRLSGQLSGGMKQKLALICTIIHNPPILLLDEPTTGVDPVSRRDFWKILYRLLTEGITLVISTPYMDEAERCNRIGLMNEGKILLVDTPVGLKQQMVGEVVEISCHQTHSVSEYLKSQEYVVSVQAFSNKIRVLIGKGSSGNIISLLESKGINVTDIKSVPPSLEDIFISRLAK